MLEHHYLDDLFNPSSIAVIGASGTPGSVGMRVMSNLMLGQFAGKLIPVNPKYTTLFNKTCYPSITAVSEQIDLAVITTPARTVPAIMEACGQKGIRLAVIISAGFSEMGEEGKVLEEAMLEKARQYHLHFVGPNCLGLMRPHSHVNATFDNNQAMPGSIALLSQSGAICAAMLDWALERNIGFSAIVSMGNSSDLDFGDMLEYLARDPLTQSIMLYIEGVHHPRGFMTGLRAAARVKPVIALKAGRHASGVRAVHSHTGALVGDDQVFSAALHRGGAVRVMDIDQLFTAAQVLSSERHTAGNRLTIITNGGGAGVMAADTASDLNIRSPEPNAALLSKLDAVLPPHWSHQNPIDILGDATPERYRQVIEPCLQDEQTDALLTVLVPVAMSQPLKVAEELCAVVNTTQKPILACWMGGKQSQASQALFAKHHIPCYSTPEEAVRAFSYLSAYRQNHQLLMQVPQPMATLEKLDVSGAALIVQAVLSEQRRILTTIESKAILSAFGVPVSQAMLAQSAAEALVLAESQGFPVVMKISATDITHKQDVEGVQLNIQDGEGVRAAYQKIMERVKAHRPGATIQGVTVEPMYRHPHYRELMVGVVRDKVFGPVISFGLGGSLVSVMKDNAVALPPLNSFLAQQLIAKTRASRMLGEFRGKPAVNMDALVTILLRVSEMICEIPEMVEMDINPLLVDEKGAIAVDARIVVDPVSRPLKKYGHMAIHA